MRAAAAASCSRSFSGLGRLIVPLDLALRCGRWGFAVLNVPRALRGKGCLTRFGQPDTGALSGWLGVKGSDKVRVGGVNRVLAAASRRGAQ